MTLEQRGEWISTEVIVYTPPEEFVDSADTIFEYRHRLMERLIEEFNVQTYLQVDSTRILHDARYRDEAPKLVSFEFTVHNLEDDYRAKRTVGIKGKLDAIVERLLEALKAEAELAEAQEKVTRTSFR